MINEMCRTFQAYERYDSVQRGWLSPALVCDSGIRGRHTDLRQLVTSLLWYSLSKYTPNFTYTRYNSIAREVNVAACNKESSSSTSSISSGDNGYDAGHHAFFQRLSYQACVFSTAIIPGMHFLFLPAITTDTRFFNGYHTRRAFFVCATCTVNVSLKGVTKTHDR